MPVRRVGEIVDGSTGSATELVENAGPVSSDELAEFEEVFAQVVSVASAVVLTGSLPSGVPADFFRRLLAHVHCPAVLDIRGPELLAALEARPRLVKPNREELAATLQRPIVDDGDLQQAIGELLRRGAQAVAVTAGKNSIWLGWGGKFLQLQPPPVERVVSPIGCGDCLAAGCAWALGQGLDLPAAIEVGMKIAAENLRTLLPCDFDGPRQAYVE